MKTPSETDVAALALSGLDWMGGWSLAGVKYEAANNALIAAKITLKFLD